MEGSHLMPGRRFEPNWRDRILTALGVVGAWALTGRSLMTDPVSVMSLLWLFIAVVNTRLAIPPWRGYVAADDEGITVHPGIGRVQHVEWAQIRGIRVGERRSPPAVERSGGSEVPLRGLIARSELDELARTASARAERGGRRNG
jgi:hypothetical protein